MHFRFDAMTLDWIMQIRSTPLEVTEALQEIADEYQYAADQMHLHKLQIVEELIQRKKGYMVRFLFPEGSDNDERWLYAVICMEIRKMYKFSKFR
ncbi:hypothetical protein [Shimazuella kribbensis]|uniref:hypothetical protein n=1 Tax=Shimazuella kribbensis TaxID=139808 RepID=UPI0012EB308F|nr:hypothetical protein [Shimazuella kribbensis]